MSTNNINIQYNTIEKNNTITSKVNNIPNNTSRPQTKTKKSTRPSASSSKKTRRNVKKKNQDEYQPNLSLVDNIIESRNTRIRVERDEIRAKSREKLRAKSREKSRQRKERRKERIEKLNALINNDKLQLRVPIMPIEEPLDNAPFLWMTLTNEEKKKAENKYFTLKELKARLRAKEKKRNERNERMEKRKQKKLLKKQKKMAAAANNKIGKITKKVDEEVGHDDTNRNSPKKKKKGYLKSNKEKKIKLKDSVFLRPITPTPPVRNIGYNNLDSGGSEIYFDEAGSNNNLAPVNITLTSGQNDLLNISRPNTRGSDAIFNEFKQLLQVAEHSDLDLRYKKFISQFRGGNPYIKTLRKVVEKDFDNNNSSDDDDDDMINSPHKYRNELDKSIPYCRRCKINVTFESEKHCITTCPSCANIVNKKDHLRFIKHKIHMKKEKARLGRMSYLKKESLRPTFGEMVKKRYNKKIRLNFVDDMNDICNFLSKRQFAGKPLGENVWKRFDVAQSRLKNNLRD